MGRNSIKYSKNTPSRKAVKKDELVIGLGNDNYGPTNLTDYYAGIDPPIGGYVVYAINAQTQKPYMFVANTNNDLIPIARTLGNKFITTVDEAIEFISNRENTTLLTGPIEVMNTVGLEANMDAGVFASYPGIGNTFQNLADTNNTGSSFNIGYKDNGIITFPSGAASTIFLKEITGLTSSYSVTAVFKNKINTTNVGVNYEISSSSTAASLPNTKFHHLTGVFSSEFNSKQLNQKIYLNGELKINSTISSSLQPVGFPLNLRINNKTLAGNSEFQKVNIWSKPLTDDEVQTNYYGASIVTDNLVFAMDAGNLVSYESGSNTAYSMTGSHSGALRNNVSYTGGNIRYFSFDGVDDYIEFPDSDAFTFSDAVATWEAWVRPTGNAGVLEHTIMTKANYTQGTREYQFQVRYSGGIYYFYLGQQNNNAGWKPIGGTTTSAITINNWYHILVTSDGNGNAQMYINGVLRDTATGWWTSQANLGAPLCVGATISGTPIQEFVGDISICRLYKKHFSPSEVLQNFTAQRTRFEV